MNSYRTKISALRLIEVIGFLEDGGAWRLCLDDVFMITVSRLSNGVTVTIETMQPPRARYMKHFEWETIASVIDNSILVYAFDAFLDEAFNAINERLNAK